tara:strand:+ start:1075 stop:1620 length:546 start_codon:yes stop_codon:yes gene_type:complete
MPTYNLLADITVSGGSTTVISFTSIDQSYTDLALFGTLKDDGTSAAGQSGLEMSFKDSGGNLMSMAGGYIARDYGSTTPYSYQYSSRTDIPSYMPNNTTSYTGVGPQYAYIYDYSSTTVAKNILWLNGITGQHAQVDNLVFQAWRMCVNDSDDDPISQIDITSQSNNFLPGATMSLYGITA